MVLGAEFECTVSAGFVAGEANTVATPATLGDALNVLAIALFNPQLNSQVLVANATGVSPIVATIGAQISVVAAPMAIDLRLINRRSRLRRDPESERDMYFLLETKTVEIGSGFSYQVTLKVSVAYT